MKVLTDNYAFLWELGELPWFVCFHIFPAFPSFFSRLFLFYLSFCREGVKNHIFDIVISF